MPLFLTHEEVEGLLTMRDTIELLEKAWDSGKEMDLTAVPDLCEFIEGSKPAREKGDEITCFLNNIGLGFQFAAVAGKVYGLAREQGAGQELPLDWFTQPVHP